MMPEGMTATPQTLFDMPGAETITPPAPSPLPNPGCAIAQGNEPNRVPDGYINIRLGECSVSFDVMPDLNAVERNLDWCYGRAKALLSGLQVSLSGSKE
jgi:hypothetical protein